MQTGAGVTSRGARSRKSAEPVAPALPRQGLAPQLCDRIAIAVLAAVAIIAAFTFRDYGLGWDDYTHSEYGDLLLKLYGSGVTHPRAPPSLTLYLYFGGLCVAG